MEKNEHAIFLDLPSGGKSGRYHSAVLTTYAIDLIHFDNQLLNMLHRKQICSVNVFADAHQMEKSMEYTSPMYMKNIGKEYSITDIRSRGAFHPKINFFIGDDDVLVVFGTGNLTVTGHGKNHEAFTGFMINEKDMTHRTLIEECWRYLCQFTSQCSEFDRKRILQEIPENCRFLDSSYTIIPHSMCKIHNDLQVALLYNESQSGILQQLSNIVPLDEVQEVTVLSPYFDESGDSLITLSQICPNSTINVLIHKNCILPPSEMPQNNRIYFYDFAETKRGKKTFKTYDRQLHAKILHFKTKDSEYCFVGSANATIPGLGTITHRGKNEEFGVLYNSKKLDFLSLLGLKTKKIIDIPSSRSKYFNDKEFDIKNKVRILSARYESRKLFINCSEEVSREVVLVVDNGDKFFKYKLDHTEHSQYKVDVELTKTCNVCYLEDENGRRMSNKIFINLLEHLQTTNPSKMTRSLNSFISRIEAGGYDGMEVVNMLSDVMWDLVNDVEEKTCFNIKVSSGEKRQADISLPELKYNPEYDNDDVKCNRIVQIDRTSRLIECIEESIRKKIRLIDDAIFDEEEEGSAEISHNREIEEQKDIIVTEKKIKGWGDLSTSLLERYQKMIDKRSIQTAIIGDGFLTKDDLNFFSLSMFAAMEICFLNRPNYKFDQKDSILRSDSQKKLSDSLDRSIGRVGLETLKKFVNFCVKIKQPEGRDKDYNKVVNRTMKYVILYGVLFKHLHQKIQQMIRNEMLIAITKLVTIFGMPSIDFLIEELEPLSKKYGYVFRTSHVENFCQEIVNK